MNCSERQLRSHQKGCHYIYNKALEKYHLDRFSSLLPLRLNLSRARKLSHFKMQSFLPSLWPQPALLLAPGSQQQRKDWKSAYLTHHLHEEFVIQKETNCTSMLWHQMVTWVELHRIPLSVSSTAPVTLPQERAARRRDYQPNLEWGAPSYISDALEFPSAWRKHLIFPTHRVC